MKNRSSGLNKPQASYGTVSATNVASFLSLTEYTDAFLWLLKFLSAEDLLHIKLLSKQYYRAFHDPEIYFPLKEFIISSTNTDLDELTTLFNLERNRRQKPDRLDKYFKCVSCELSNYEFTHNQFRIQKFLLISAFFACTTLTVASGLLFLFFSFDKRFEYATISIITLYSSIISCLCIYTACWAYTSCCRPLNHYYKQVSKLRVIQNDINNAKMTNTLFAYKKRAGFNNDSSKTSDMEEGLLANFFDEEESLEETLHQNSPTV